jgi:hypothetical protein
LLGNIRQNRLSRVGKQQLYADLREDYLLALRALSRGGKTAPLIKMLRRAQLFSSQMDFTSYDTARSLLQQCHAFTEPDEGLNLKLPAEMALTPL